MNIYLDDLRVPKMSHSHGRNLGETYSQESKWIIVRDYFEFVKIIDSSLDKIELISFDHDLACYKDDQEFTGKNAADYVIQSCLEKDIKFPSWYVHSDNTSGKKNIIGTILNYLRVIEGLDVSKFRYYHNGILNGLLV
jgi:hypothetical protein